MDIALLRSVNDLAGTNIVLDTVGIFAAVWLIGVIAALIAAFWYLRPHERWIAVVNVGLAAALAYLVNQFIGEWYFRPRPFESLSDIHRLIAPLSDKSFPSDHSALAFAIAFAVFMVNRRWGSVLIVLAAVVALGRVFVGVHYPSDVLMGAAVGTAAALTVHFITHRLLRSHHRAAKQL